MKEKSTLAATEIIKKRVSYRTYSDKSIEDNVIKKFSVFVNAVHTGPFGNQPRFRLLNRTPFMPDKGERLGTYGVIKNARLFLAGTIKKGFRALEDYGYCMELLILKATSLDLGTCWLGGTFNASGFAEAVDLREGEMLPAVSPVGYPAEDKSFTERMFRYVSGADRRKPWSELFFNSTFFLPLTRSQAGRYDEVLENLRLAPSASNKQPWRVLRDAAHNCFHFYLARSLFYTLREISLQDIDMGIAMSHFEITARELAINGDWIIDDDAPAGGSLEYIASWQEKSRDSMQTNKGSD